MYECEGDSISNPGDDMMSLDNSSLGMQCESVEEFARGTDSKTAQPSQIPQSSHSHTVNTRIVCGEFQDSQNNSESTSPLTCEREPKQSIKTDSKKSKSSIDLESQTTKNKDSQLDSKTMDCHDFAPAKSRNNKKTESKPLFFRINSHSTILESTSNAHIKAHSLYFTYKRGYYA